jgi:hypothetical protein
MVISGRYLQLEKSPFIDTPTILVHTDAVSGPAPYSEVMGLSVIVF